MDWAKVIVYKSCGEKIIGIQKHAGKIKRLHFYSIIFASFIDINLMLLQMVIKSKLGN